MSRNDRTHIYAARSSCLANKHKQTIPLCYYFFKTNVLTKTMFDVVITNFPFIFGKVGHIIVNHQTKLRSDLYRMLYKWIIEIHRPRQAKMCLRACAKCKKKKKSDSSHACAVSSEHCYSLWCPMILLANSEVLIRLQGCAGWSAHSLLHMSEDTLSHGGAYFKIAI